MLRRESVRAAMAARGGPIKSGKNQFSQYASARTDNDDDDSYDEDDEDDDAESSFLSMVMMSVVVVSGIAVGVWLYVRHRSNNSSGGNRSLHRGSRQPSAHSHNNSLGSCLGHGLGLGIGLGSAQGDSYRWRSVKNE